jgi:hypothetical protein
LAELIEAALHNIHSYCTVHGPRLNFERKMGGKITKKKREDTMGK